MATIKNRKEYKAQWFIPVCLGEVDFDSLVFHDDEQKRICRESFYVSNKCRYCGETVTREDKFCITETYWSAIGCISHTDCLKEGKSSEEYECQSLDRSCNDCRFFVRDQVVGTTSIGTCKNPHSGILTVKAYPVTSIGHRCFKHRKEC